MMLGSSYSLSHPSGSRQEGGGGSSWFGWLTKSDSSRERAAGREGGLTDMARSIESKPRNEHEEVQVRRIRAYLLLSCDVFLREVLFET
jgi:hypothetical protein